MPDARGGKDRQRNTLPSSLTRLPVQEGRELLLHGVAGSFVVEIPSQADDSPVAEAAAHALCSSGGGWSSGRWATTRDRGTAEPVGKLNHYCASRALAAHALCSSGGGWWATTTGERGTAEPVGKLSNVITVS